MASESLPEKKYMASESTGHDVINITEAEPIESDPRTPPKSNNASSGGEKAAAAATTLVTDKTLSTAANLVQLLPTGTVLAFQTFSSSFTNHGTCYTSNRYLSAVLIAMCTFSCVFFAFTDSFRGSDNKLYCGLATAKGFFVFNYEGAPGKENEVLGDSSGYAWRFLDFVHAFFGVLLFLAVAFSDLGVQNCFFPTAGKNTKELLVNLPLGVGFLSGVVFVVFPTTRKGIGYSGTAGQRSQ